MARREEMADRFRHLTNTTENPLQPPPKPHSAPETANRDSGAENQAASKRKPTLFGYDIDSANQAANPTRSQSFMDYIQSVPKASGLDAPRTFAEAANAFAMAQKPQTVQGGWGLGRRDGHVFCGTVWAHPDSGMQPTLWQSKADAETALANGQPREFYRNAVVEMVHAHPRGLGATVFGLPMEPTPEPTGEQSQMDMGRWG